MASSWAFTHGGELPRLSTAAAGEGWPTIWQGMNRVVEVVAVQCESDDEEEDENVYELSADAVHPVEDPRNLQREAQLSEEALRAAAAEGLTLKSTGSRFVGVHQWKDGTTRLGSVQRGAGHRFFAKRKMPGGFLNYLGSFVTAEEAALAYARSLAANPPTQGALFHGDGMSAQEAIAAAEKEGIELIHAPGTSSGFKAVSVDTTTHKRYPYGVAFSRDGRLIHIGSFATAEEAALEYARAIGPEAANEAARHMAKLEAGLAASIYHPGYIPPSVETPDEVMQQVAAEGLTLHRSVHAATGYKGVTKQKKNSKDRPYVARLLTPKAKHLGSFPTLLQAALCYARARAADPAVT